MSKKFIFVNAQGDYEETVGAYESSDFINTSEGAGDAGKPIVLDAGGKLAASFIDQSDIDHGSITGLSDDDHTQYSKADGTRDFSGIVAYDSSKTFTDPADIVDKNYVDTQIAASGTSAEWQDSVLDVLLTPPGSPSTGDRYLINGTGTGAWASHDYEIAEYDGASWDFTVCSTGTFVSVDDETDGIYYFGGTGPWVKKTFEALTASLGVEIVGSDIRLDLLSGGGLKLTGNEVGVEPNDFAGAGLVDDGSDNLAIDWSTAFNDAKAVKASDLNSVANGVGASIIGIEDAGGYTTTTNVEAALQEIYGEIEDVGGIDYTVGVGGVTAGDLVYISGNNTVLPYDDITVAQVVIGAAAETKNAGETVKVLANDTVLAGVISGATAGTKYYWDGSNGWITNLASFGSGEYIWLGGVAKNATDVHVDIEFVKKTS